MAGYRKTEEHKRKISEALEKSWAERLNRRVRGDPFVCNGKLISTKYMCSSCGREARATTQETCSFCGASIISKVVVDAEAKGELEEDSTTIQP